MYKRVVFHHRAIAELTEKEAKLALSERSELRDLLFAALPVLDLINLEDLKILKRWEVQKLRKNIRLKLGIE